MALSHNATSVASVRREHVQVSLSKDSAAFCQKSVSMGNGVSDIILLDQIKHGHAGEHALIQCMLHIARI